MNPPLDPGDQSRLDDLVRRLDRAEMAADISEREALQREREVTQLTDKKLDALATAVGDLRDVVDELQSGAARRRDVVTLACAAIAPTVGLIGVLFATKGS